MLDPNTIDFLRDLKHNNHKGWFDQNRNRYDIVKSDYLNLASNILAEMKKADETLDILSPKDCIFRINKDIRFSKDKTPYKTNLGIALHPYGKKMQLAAYYVHIEEGQSFVGGGLWAPEAPLLSKVRKEIHYFYNDLETILENSAFKKTFGSLDVEEGQKLSRPPKGYEMDDQAIEFLKLKSFTVSRSISDSILTSEKLMPFIVESFKVLQPFLIFINRGLMSDEDGGL
ncbi:MAG: DUF2461 domain-containing protein [Saprospiraceae bacterium]|nr:DUF2461 domain-containing protein [Saprospiraceae bacterium]